MPQEELAVGWEGLLGNNVTLSGAQSMRRSLRTIQETWGEPCRLFTHPRDDCCQEVVAELESFLTGKNGYALKSLHEAGEYLPAFQSLEVPDTLHRNLLSINAIENSFRNTLGRVTHFRAVPIKQLICAAGTKEGPPADLLGKELPKSTATLQAKKMPSFGLLKQTRHLNLPETVIEFNNHWVIRGVLG